MSKKKHPNFPLYQNSHKISIENPKTVENSERPVENSTAKPSSTTTASQPAPIMIQASNVHKSFRLPTERASGLKQAILNWFKGVKGYTEHQVLKGISFDVHKGEFIGIVGRNGSGKSTLVNEILASELLARLHRAQTVAGLHDRIDGIEHLDKCIVIDQSPIGRTPRSNAATYTGVFNQIRELFAQQPEAQLRGYKSGRFSFNVKGGRCEHCQGDGVNKIEMHFLPDVYVTCPVCHGKRYNHEALEVKYKGKDISEVLGMTIDEAVEFFGNIPAIYNKLLTIQEVGLGYIKLGQPATTFSGGEAQRIKLATELARRSTGKTLYILDEPTTGLHTDDVKRLLEILGRLVDGGNSMIIIEHNLHVIKSADWLIDMGPEGGIKGGEVVATGTPEQLAADGNTPTGKYLRDYLQE